MVFAPQVFVQCATEVEEEPKNELWVEFLSRISHSKISASLQVSLR